MTDKWLFLLIGQSNMAGRGLLEPQQSPFSAEVLMLDASDHWIPAQEPIHFDKPIAGAGLAKTFASELVAKAPGRPLGLIPCAVGGSPLSQWEQGAPLYLEAIRRTLLAQAGGGKLGGILWHQGEQDGLDQQCSQTYLSRLITMLTHLRCDLNSPDVPVIVGTLGSFVRELYPDRFMPLIDAALRELPEHLSHSRCVEAGDLPHGGDSLHFSTEAVRELGLRYAEAYLSIRNN